MQREEEDIDYEDCTRLRQEFINLAHSSEGREQRMRWNGEVEEREKEM